MGSESFWHEARYPIRRPRNVTRRQGRRGGNADELLVGRKGIHWMPSAGGPCGPGTSESPSWAGPAASGASGIAPCRAPGSPLARRWFVSCSVCSRSWNSIVFLHPPYTHTPGSSGLLTRFEGLFVSWHWRWWRGSSGGWQCRLIGGCLGICILRPLNTANLSGPSITYDEVYARGKSCSTDFVVTVIAPSLNLCRFSIVGF